MSTKLMKCLELLKNKTSKDSKLHKQIITIVKSLDFDISYITDYFLKDTYSIEDIKILWNSTKSNSRWGWTELLLILEDNITRYEYTDLIENYFKVTCQSTILKNQNFDVIFVKSIIMFLNTKQCINVHLMDIYVRKLLSRRIQK